MNEGATLERYSETLSYETHVAVRGTALDQRADVDKGSILVNTALERGSHALSYPLRGGATLVVALELNPYEHRSSTYSHS